MKYQVLFSLKNNEKKPYSKLSFSAVATCALRVNNQGSMRQK